MWRYYNPNPMARRTIDCAVRALCKATGRSWDEVHRGLCKLAGQMCTMPSANEVWGAYLRREGWRRYAVPDECDCYTVRDFCQEHKEGRYVLCPSGHVVAAEDGRYYDTFDSGDDVVLYFWKEG